MTLQHLPDLTIQQWPHLTVTDSWWAIFAAIVAAIAAFFSAVAAIATSILAFVTNRLVKKTADMSKATNDMADKTAGLATQAAKQVEETAESMDQAQRHHEQSLMPLVWVKIDCQIRPRSVEWFFDINGTVLNSGPGLATAVYLHLKTGSFTPPESIYLGIIAANSEEAFERSYSLGNARQPNRLVPYDCVTKYTTIFDTLGAIAQNSHTGGSPAAVVTRYFPPQLRTAQEIRLYLDANGFPM